MAEIIYAKYNKLRRKAFRICTVICEERGERWVEKRALCPEAEEHIARMVDMGACLKAVYPKIDFVPARKVETGVRFDYLTGVTVDSRIAQTVKTAKALKREFAEVFRWILPSGKSKVPVNLDCNLDNFLIVGDRIVCLDYEWVAESEVPVDFLKYRVINYYYGAHPETVRLISEADLLAEFKISAEDQACFKAMEQEFQKYVFGEEENARYTDNYRLPIIDFDRVAKEQKEEIRRLREENTELQKVVGHYSQVEGKLRKIGLWQLLQAGQKIGRKVKTLIKK